MNYLTARSSNLAAFNTIQLNVSTLTGSTIQTTATANTSSIVVSTLATRAATYSTLTGSTITTSSIITPVIATATGFTTIGQNTSFPNRSIEIGSDAANSVYFDFHSNDAASIDYSTRIQSIGGSTIGQGHMMIQGSTINILGTSGVGIGTSNPPNAFHVYGASAPAIGMGNSTAANFFQIGAASFGGSYSSSAVAGDAVIRTTSGNLMLQTGTAAAAMYVNTSNNIILNYNTSSPSTYKLCVEQGLSNNNGILISNSNYGSAQQFQLSMVNAGSGNFYSYAMIQTNTSGVAASVPLCLQPNSASVGIGTTAPTGKCHIYGTGQSTGLTDVYSLNVSSPDSFNGDGGRTVYSESINMKAGDLTWGGGVRVYGARIYIGGGYSINAAQNQGYVAMYTGNTERMRIADNGYVGIGTATPGSYLSLYSASAGNILSISGYSNTSISLYDGLRGYSSMIGQKGQSTSDCALQFYNSSPGIASGSAIFTFLNPSVSTMFAIYNNGSVSVPGSLSKGSGTFDIQHPLSNTPDKRLVHSFIEGPRCDLIYRGKTTLNQGIAKVDINKECTHSPECSMDDGTFEALCANPQIFLQNNNTFDRVIGSISGCALTITCENANSTAVIEWMIIAERADPHIKEWDRTNPDGYLITQYTKEIVTVIP